MKIGIVGLPNVGKSTLFNSLTKMGVESSNYPFCTIEPNVGMVYVPDERLDVLAQIYDSEKIVPSFVEFVDIAGLVKGASKGEGLGNKFLSHIRETDAIVHVVRCFDNENIVHVDGSVDPIRDVQVIELELILADLEVAQKRKEKLTRLLKADKSYQKEADLIDRIIAVLESGSNIRSMDLTDEEKEMIKGFGFLSSKDVIYVANTDEKGLVEKENNPYLKALYDYAKEQNSTVCTLCVKNEQELSQIEDEEEKQEMLELFGLDEPGLNRLVKLSYDILGLMSFLTAGKQEVRSWTIKKGTKAPDAAGKIHSDIKRGFIKAEIISYPDLVECKSIAKAREKGLVRMEGKDYIMKDDDIVDFKFNV